MRIGLQRRTLDGLVSTDGPPKATPLWQFMRTMQHSPRAVAPQSEDELPPREITEDDLEPLRTEGHWRPSGILERFGPVEAEGEDLARLLIACAVIQGPHRLQEMTVRLRTIMCAYLPRMKQMRANDDLQARRSELSDVYKKLNSGSQELIQTRARAANDMDGAFTHSDGLRIVDLLILVSQVQVTVQAHELVQRRNIAGLDFGLAVAAQAPDMRTAEEWLDRLMGNAELNGILLFWPPEYGRVVVVYEDGRLAYDPAAEEMEPED